MGTDCCVGRKTKYNHTLDLGGNQHEVSSASVYLNMRYFGLLALGGIAILVVCSLPLVESGYGFAPPPSSPPPSNAIVDRNCQIEFQRVCRIKSFFFFSFRRCRLERIAVCAGEELSPPPVPPAPPPPAPPPLPPPPPPSLKGNNEECSVRSECSVGVCDLGLCGVSAGGSCTSSGECQTILEGMLTMSCVSGTCRGQPEGGPCVGLGGCASGLTCEAHGVNGVCLMPVDYDD